MRPPLAAVTQRRPPASESPKEDRHATDVVELPERCLGFERAFLVRDPDGHALRFAEP